MFEVRYVDGWLEWAVYRDGKLFFQWTFPCEWEAYDAIRDAGYPDEARELEHIAWSL